MHVISWSPWKMSFEEALNVVCDILESPWQLPLRKLGMHTTTNRLSSKWLT